MSGERTGRGRVLSGTVLFQRDYAQRLGVSYGRFRQAFSFKRASEEGRILSSPAYRFPYVRDLAPRIAAPSRYHGRAPVWEVSDVEAFEASNPSLSPEGAAPPVGRRGRPTGAPLPEALAGISAPELRSRLENVVERGVLDETAARAFITGYGLLAGFPGQEPDPRRRSLSMAEIGATLGISTSEENARPD